LPLNDVNGMMRHILDCLGSLKVRIEEGLSDGKKMINFLLLYFLFEKAHL
jgi:hypothetical protein